MSPPLPSSLGRLAGALFALALVPALAFAAMQIFVQSESERQLADLRNEQLEGLLFWVNQNSWDTASVWADRLARSGASPDDATRFLQDTPAVRSVLEADSTGTPVQWSGDEAPPPVPEAVAQRLLAQHQVGYRKIEPVALEDGTLALTFAADGVAPDAPPRLLAMIVEPDDLLDTAVLPTLRDQLRGSVAFGIFREDDPSPVASTPGFARVNVEHEAGLWLLPGHVAGIRPEGASAEASMRRRLWQSLLLIGGVTAGLGVGALLVWRGVRREIEVARLREDFVSNVSHELRTPLALIRMYAESLQQGRVPEAKRPRYYDTLVAESERLSRLVGNVLQYNRFERGTATVDRSPVDVSEIAAEIADRYRPVVERDGGTLEVDLEDVPTVAGDRDLLSEALVNLIDNAVKYGGGAVEVATRATEKAVVLEVADRGSGIDTADLERVFEPFVRLQPESDDGLVHTAKGTGLGLALVQRVAVSHNGSVTATARDGGGTVFHLSLPTDA
ncbi:sensor histidine kinase [Rubrivirga sp.]|uniref:sensor histidine kinase n=1 Tax=Rubrivirga sp. TaxID=1885344 RepID=UPI003C760FD1